MNATRLIILIPLLVIGVLPACDSTTVVVPEILSVAFANETEAWIVRRDGQLVHIHGEYKRIRSFETPIRQVDFLSSTQGWVLDSSGRVWGTKDGGAQWDRRGTIGRKVGGSDDQIRFLNESSGWVNAGGSIFATVDGGYSWRKIFPVGSFDDNSYRHSVIAFSRIDETHAWLVTTGSEAIFTKDGGSSWVSSRFPEKVEPRSVCARTNSEVWVGTWGHGVLKTIDEGDSWEQEMTFADKDRLGINAIECKSASRIWAVGIRFVADTQSMSDRNGIVLTAPRSEDQSIHVADPFFEIPFRDVQFKSALVGWLVADDKILVTTDAGRSWSEIYTE